MEGDIELPGESAPQAPRGPMRLAVNTANYFGRLATRG